MHGLRRLRRPKVFIPLIIVLLILAAFVLAAHNLNSPANGIVTTQSAGSSANTPPPTQKHYSDKILSFTYPYKYSVQSTDKTAPYLDVVNLVATARRDQYVAISLLNESLSNDSGVNYRKTHPDLYKVASEGANNIVFAKTDQTEYTGYIGRGGKVAAVSLTAVSATDLSSDYNQIASSIEWR